MPTAQLTAERRPIVVVGSRLPGSCVLRHASSQVSSSTYDAGPLLTKCHGIGLTPDGRELWAASNIEGNVRVYSTPDLRELAVVAVGTMPNWIAFSRDGATAYVTNTDPASDHGAVSIIDVRARRVTATLDVGRAPKRVHRIDVARD